MNILNVDILSAIRVRKWGRLGRRKMPLDFPNDFAENADNPSTSRATPFL